MESEPGAPAETSLLASVVRWRSRFRLYARYMLLTGRMHPAPAEGSWRLTREVWLASLIRTARGAAADDYGMMASAIAFSSFLALLPLLAAVALIYGMTTAPDRVVSDIRTLLVIVPDDARAFLGDWLVASITNRKGRGIGLLIAFGVIVLSALRAGRSIITGLNVASDVSQPRSFLRRRFAALLIVASGAALMLSALLVMSALAWIENVLLFNWEALVSPLRAIFWGATTIGAGATLALVYRHGPAREPPGWRWVLPGALSATLGWLAATLAFGAYLGAFGQTGRTYGSVGAVVVLQIWLFLSAYIFLLGAKLNAEVRRGACSPAAADDKDAAKA